MYPSFHPYKALVAFVFSLLAPSSLWAQVQEIQLHDNGTTTTLALPAEGATLPTPPAVGNFVFAGWSTTAVSLGLATPTFVGDATGRLMPNPSITQLYAVYKQEVEQPYFKKVDKPQAGKRYIFAGTSTTGITVALDLDQIKSNKGKACPGTPVTISILNDTPIILPKQSKSNLVWEAQGTDGEEVILKCQGNYLYTTASYFGYKENQWSVKWNKTFYTNTNSDSSSSYVKTTGTIGLSKSAAESAYLRAFEETTGALTYYTSTAVHKLTFGKSEYATLTSPVALQLPEGLQAFTGKLHNGSLQLTALQGVIPARTGVVLRGTPQQSYTLPLALNAPEALESNELQAAMSRVEASTIQADAAHSYYALANKNGNIAFYPIAAGVSIPEGKAYLKLSKAAHAPAFVLRFEHLLTGLQSSSTLTPTEAPMFDLSGRRIAQPSSGQIYLQGGLKHIAP